MGEFRGCKSVRISYCYKDCKFALTPRIWYVGFSSRSGFSSSLLWVCCSEVSHVYSVSLACLSTTCRLLLGPTSTFSVCFEFLHFAFLCRIGLLGIGISGHNLGPSLANASCALG